MYSINTSKKGKFVAKVPATAELRGGQRARSSPRSSSAGAVTTRDAVRSDEDPGPAPGSFCVPGHAFILLVLDSGLRASRRGSAGLRDRRRNRPRRVGIVIAGRHRALGREVAIKQLAIGLGADERRPPPVPRRGAGAGPLRPPAHRPDLRLRRARWRVPARDGAADRRHRLPADALRRPGAADLVQLGGGALRRPPVRARARGPAPRRQAREHDVLGRRDAPGDRLRDREADERDEPDEDAAR